MALFRLQDQPQRDEEGRELDATFFELEEESDALQDLPWQDGASLRGQVTHRRRSAAARGRCARGRGGAVQAAQLSNGGLPAFFGGVRLVRRYFSITSSNPSNVSRIAHAW
jgi:hypothetical protein